MQSVCQMNQDQANALAGAYSAGGPSDVVTSFENDFLSRMDGAQQTQCRQAALNVQNCAMLATMHQKAHDKDVGFTTVDTVNRNDGLLEDQKGMTGPGVFPGASVGPLSFAPVGGGR